MEQKKFEFMVQNERKDTNAEVVLDQETVEILVGLMASALLAVVAAAAEEVSDAR